jgi:glutamate-1-semialdehyde 2,1-aminomutase
MDQLAPLGPVYQAGTLSGNPLAMAAGIAMLQYLEEHRTEVYRTLEQRSAAVADGVAEVAAGLEIPLTTNRVGAMFTWFFTGEPVTDFAGAARSSTERFAAFHQAMLDAGVWLPPSQFEAAFLSTAHSEADVQAIVEAARGALAPLAGR